MLDSMNPAHIALLDIHKSSTFEATQWLHAQKPDVVWIENIHAFPGMASNSNFGMGKSVGKVHAIAEMATHGLLAKLVVARTWQKYIGITAKGKEIKQQVADIAQKLYPTAIIHGKQGGLLDGRSDALMIAHYGLNHKD